MIGTKIWKNNTKDYTKWVIWCGKNNATIEEKKDYYEIVEYKPPTITLEEAKKDKIEEINSWTKKKIIGGFASNCYNNQIITYDSDVETQITVQGICLNVKTELFAQRYPQGCPIRGYLEGEKEKKIFLFTPEQLLRWQADLSTHIGTCKQEGWVMQQKVANAKTKEELNSIVLENPQIRVINDSI